eukprot:m.224627 g.224627  ORF g.224627 m.224627 type:complete len:100 (-) comp17034_c2_seq16:451-750(-)
MNNFHQQLCEAIAMTKTMIAQQVVRNDLGQEVMLSFGSSPMKVDSPSGRKSIRAPEYLEEDDEPENDPNSAQALTKTGADNGSSWLGALGGYLAKTFYW